MSDKGDWFQFVRINLEWINPSMKLDVPRYVDDMLDTMQEFNSNAVAYCYDSGGYPVYESDLAPKDTHVGGDDLMRLLREGTRKRGQYFYIGLLGQPNLYVARTYPQWRIRDRDGRHVEWYSITVCNNSPYGDWLARLVGEAVTAYDPDGVYMEGVTASFCYCSYCQEMFRREYGREIPVGTREELLTDKEYTAFRYNSVTTVYRRVRAAIDRTRPQTVFVGCVYYPDGVNIRDLTEYVDGISMERQWGYSGMFPPLVSPLVFPLREMGLHTQMVRAEGRRPVYSSMFIDKHVDMDYSPRSPDHLRLNFMGILQCGGTVQIHIQNEYMIDRTTLPTVRELYTAEQKMRPYLMNAEIVGQVALLDWADPRDVAIHPDPAQVGGARPGTYLDDSFRGYYRALLEHHIPTRILTVEDVEAGELAKFPVLVLANAECLSDRVHEELQAYVG
jgi:hypothetical protein